MGDAIISLGQSWLPIGDSSWRIETFRLPLSYFQLAGHDIQALATGATAFDIELPGIL